ncbi:MAG: sugar ABC transporter substrate-binding protein [Spirochaetales bacterium]|nr:sugar ABC transporter substrate-binding protein [Spirochaetales bacterium]
MKKLALLVLALALALAGTTAFAAGGQEAAAEEGKITVATITYTSEIEWFYILEQNYKDVAAELGIELIQLDPGAKPQTQVDMIEQMTQRGVDAILISPVDPQVIRAAVEEAMAKGIHVLIQGQERETVPWSTANFGYDEKQMGTLTGEIAAAGVKQKYPNAKEIKLAVLGDPGWASSNVRMGGAKEAFMKGLPGVKVSVVVDGVMGSTIETATNVIESALQQHPDLRCVVGINDDAAIGAVGAMQQQGVDVLKEACIAGAGNNKGTWPYIDRGEILGSVDLNHRGTAEVALNAVVKLVNGESVPGMMYIDMIKVTPANLGQWYKK